MNIIVIIIGILITSAGLLICYSGSGYNKKPATTEQTGTGNVAIGYESLKETQKEKPVYIGEYFRRPYVSGLGYPDSWIKFTKEDVQDEIGVNIKIKEQWLNKNEIIMYDDFYKDKRKAIEDNINWVKKGVKK